MHPSNPPRPPPPPSALHTASLSLDESFVLLAGASQLLRPPPGTLPRAPLAARFAAFGAALQRAADAGAADAPLCLDCAGRVAAELDAEAEAATADADAFEAAVAALEEGRGADAARFARADTPAAATARADVARARAAAAADAEAAAAADYAAAVADADAVDAAEADYWRALDATVAAASTLADSTADAAAKARRARAALADLSTRDALADLWPIWHDGPYATVAGCRAGRGPGVGWDETNAALGGAIALVDALARVHRVTLTSATLLPSGSTPRVGDGRGVVHDVYGPVNRLYCGGFDRGLVLFASAVAELASNAAAADTAASRPPLTLPYPLDGDRVGGMTLRLMLNKDARWTRALKALLANVKALAAWSAAARARERQAKGSGAGGGGDVTVKSAPSAAEGGGPPIVPLPAGVVG